MYMQTQICIINTIQQNTNGVCFLRIWKEIQNFINKLYSVSEINFENNLKLSTSPVLNLRQLQQDKLELLHIVQIHSQESRKITCIFWFKQEKFNSKLLVIEISMNLIYNLFLVRKQNKSIEKYHTLIPVCQPNPPSDNLPKNTLISKFLHPGQIFSINFTQVVFLEFFQWNIGSNFLHPKQVFSQEPNLYSNYSNLIQLSKQQLNFD
eukprot:TRINITY_DN3637_c0_g1_i1.p2 TRINITY_DN3637_c0_g1~~TRINITY_DN3637_c0_g1_i1.p2  ORF type:complete len:208 (+),score=-16.41 TRINITY_DN3637_c0_g1_i1:552-1175(+)